MVMQYHESIPDDNVARAVVNAVSKIYGIEDMSEISYDYPLANIGGDELDFVEFLTVLEEGLKIKIPPEDEGNITSIRATTDYVKQLLGEKAMA